MKKNLFLNVFRTFLYISLILIVLILLMVFQQIKKYNIDQMENDLKQINQAVIFLEKQNFNTLNMPALKTRLDQLGQELKLRFTYIQPDGKVLIDNQKDPKLMENHLSRIEVLTALNNKIGRDIHYSETLKKEMIYVAIPVIKNNEVIGILRSSVSVNSVNKLVSDIQLRILIISLILLIAAEWFIYVFYKKLLAPMLDIEQVTEKYASGDFKARIGIKNIPEWQNLAKKINDLGESLQRLFDENIRQKEKLETIIESIQEGLAVIDNSTEKLILSNSSFRNILGEDSSAEENYLSILRTPDFINLIREASTRLKYSKEIELKDKTYLASVACINQRQETALLLHDITELKKADNLQKEFIVNVSHELRTPLTAVKGFAETLEDELTGEQKKYIEIIRKNAERLINIVEDLLVLSEMTEKTFILKKEKLFLSEIIEKTAKLFEQKIKGKQLKLVLDIEENLPAIMLDGFKIEQVFINLLDNAVKYTEKGEIKITALKKNNEIVISIQDTGLGIPQQSISRIFDRFYVIDKSRSRKMGGTGLGLSIVKHIVLLHNGKISVKSEVNKGSIFIIKLPAI